MILDKSIFKKLFTEKTKDYSYTIIFFLAFSFFIFFVIRPNLVSVFDAYSQVSDLSQEDKTYGSQIEKIIDIQSTMEQSRSDLGLLDQAVTNTPQVNQLLRDVQNSTTKSGLLVNRVSVSDINLKDVGNGDKVSSVDLEIDVSGTYNELVSFLKDTQNQRRLKFIKKMNLSKTDTTSTPQASASSALELQLVIEGYYL